MAPCMRSSEKQSSLMRVWMDPNAAYAAMGVMKVVRTTSQRLMPSIATW